MGFKKWFENRKKELIKSWENDSLVYSRATFEPIIPSANVEIEWVYEFRGDGEMINMNELAKKVTIREGGKQSLSIAQVKEVLRIALSELAYEDPIEVLKLLRRYE